MSPTGKVSVDIKTFNQESRLIGFIFDGGNSSIYDHREVFTDREVKISCAIVEQKIGESCYMSWEQIRELQNDYGWTFMNHTRTHSRFSDISENEVKEQVNSCHQKAARESIELRALVYPYNDTGRPEDRKAVSRLYPYAFGKTDDFITPDSDPFSLPRYSMDKLPTSKIKETIDEAADKGAGLILYGHDIVGGTEKEEGPLSVSTTKLQNVIEHIQNHPANAEIALPSEVARFYLHSSG